MTLLGSTEAGLGKLHFSKKPVFRNLGGVLNVVGYLMHPLRTFKVEFQDLFCMRWKEKVDFTAVETKKSTFGKSRLLG